ncbi:uncharacterized protein LOC122500076 [Leptopilina heterotoma]|uniref:uncharacterized protein LOC122500076 n=1 Tax=Leptopilina heterotoma TaxID=63436 RepID=UPI001CAA0BAD|nr:uncharacterized protein LOC122500076 [Leptopilina heterotoma]
MASNRVLRNFCVIFCILSIWSNTVVNTMDEWDNLNELPDLGRDELEMYGIEFQDADSDILDEFLPGGMRSSEQSEDDRTLNYTQAVLLEKWHIDANIENLTRITRHYVDKPKLMSSHLLRMILDSKQSENERTSTPMQYIYNRDTNRWD